KEMGRLVVSMYLLGISVSSIGFGLLTDYVVNLHNIDIHAQIQGAAEVLPEWMALVSVAVLIFASIKPLRQRVFA
ncbi:MAG: hypothetical protein QM484_08220, partial [Woeseiaceae bacterium]